MSARAGLVDAAARGEHPTLADRVHRLVVDGVVPADRDAITEAVRAADPLLGLGGVLDVVERVKARVHGLGSLEPLLALPGVTEVMANGPGPVWIERDGRLVRTTVSLDRPTLEQLIERVVAPLDRRVDRSSPLLDARLPDGSRVNVVLPPLAVDGPYLTIRRFAQRACVIADVAGPTLGALLVEAVVARRNIVVTGAAGAGKTTLLNALAGHIPSGERVITVEDAAELCLPGHVVRLEVRPGNADGLGEVTIRDLVRNALRMRPDRIVVGECRGAEALDMVQAMTTGHAGSLSTVHGSSPSDAMRRLETLVLMGGTGLPSAVIRQQLASAIDLVVQMVRGRNGTRQVGAVARVGPDPSAGWSLEPVGERTGA